MHRLVISIIAAACGGGGKQVPATGGGGKQCPSLPPDFEAMRERETERAQQAFTKALAAKQLTPWTGQLASIRGVTDDSASQPNQIRFSAERESAIGSPSRDQVGELVVDPQGVVFRVVRSASAGGKRYTLCGCSPPGRGTMIAIEQYIAELPANTTFGGDVMIAYSDNTPHVGYDNTMNGRPCSAPP